MREIVRIEIQSTLKMSKNNIDRHYEYLSKLYLRLKGFVCSNSIIHSETHGNSKSELDIIAVRMPFHSQNYRKVIGDDFLESSNSRIEIIIADVKNTTDRSKIRFNKGLRNDDSSIKQLIEWLGIYESTQKEHIDKFKTYLNLQSKSDWNGFATFDEELNFGKFSFKFTFFCPSLAKRTDSRFRYIDGEELIDFIWQCLNETKTIESCSRRYSFTGWNELEKYVRFFKKKSKKPTIADFEKHFETIDL